MLNILSLKEKTKQRRSVKPPGKINFEKHPTIQIDNVPVSEHEVRKIEEWRIRGSAFLRNTIYNGALDTTNAIFTMTLMIMTADVRVTADVTPALIFAFCL